MKKRLVLPVVALLGVLAVSGCAPAGPVTPPTPTSSEVPVGITVVFSDDVDPGIVLSGGDGVDLPWDIPAGLALFPGSLVGDSVYFAFFDEDYVGEMMFAGSPGEMELLFPAYEELGYVVTPATEQSPATATNEKYNVTFFPEEGKYTLVVSPPEDD